MTGFARVNGPHPSHPGTSSVIGIGHLDGGLGLSRASNQRGYGYLQLTYASESDVDNPVGPAFRHDKLPRAQSQQCCSKGLETTKRPWQLISKRLHDDRTNQQVTRYGC